MALDIKGSIGRGGKRAEEMQEENRLPGGRFESINWFKLADKETVIVRFLDDAHEWLSVLQHPFAPTRPAPDSLDAEAKKKWPQQLSPICRRTPEFMQFFPDGCYICDEMHNVRPNPRGKKSTKYFSQVRLWCRAVEREAVIVKDQTMASQYDAQIGDILGYRDVEVEVDETDAEGNSTGKKIMKKKILVINMALKNFFGPLQGYADVYGTVLDRDYQITRKGADQTTDYNIVPLNPIERADGSRLHMGKSMEIVNGQETDRLLRDIYFADGPDLFAIVEGRLDDEFYNRFFDDRVAVPVRESDTKESGNGAGTAPKASSPAPSAPTSASDAPVETLAPAADQNATAAKLAAMRNRVKGDNPTAGQSQDGVPSPEDSSPQPAGAGGARKMADFS